MAYCELPEGWFRHSLVSTHNDIQGTTLAFFGDPLRSTGSCKHRVRPRFLQTDKDVDGAMLCQVYLQGQFVNILYKFCGPLPGPAPVYS